MAYEYDEDEPQYGVASAGVSDRAIFITRTYMHLLGAIVAFTLIEIYLFSSGLAETMAQAMLGTSWLLVLGGFMVASWIASRMAHTAKSLASQYMGLGLFVVAEAIIFVPLLWMADTFAPGVISSAAAVTLVGFAVLTAVVFVTRKDFSFLRGILMWGFGIAILAIIAGAIFGFALGTYFSVAMVGLAGAAILYDTSNVLHHFPKDRYVGAALELFASVALMFWYVLQLFMSADD